MKILTGGVANSTHIDKDFITDSKFYFCLEELHLTQAVTVPTFRKTRFEPPTSMLDLIITDEPERILELESAEDFGCTDMGRSHCLIKGKYLKNGTNGANNNNSDKV